jgi:hypothetical protein
MGTTALTQAYDAIIARPKSSERLDGAAVIVSFAAFLLGSFMIVGAIALWGFHSLAGWPGVIVALIASTVLTVVFRDRMRTPTGVE